MACRASATVLVSVWTLWGAHLFCGLQIVASKFGHLPPHPLITMRESATTSNYELKGLSDADDTSRSGVHTTDSRQDYRHSREEHLPTGQARQATAVLGCQRKADG